MSHIRHNPRCAIFDEPPGLQDAKDCNCGAIPPLPITNQLVTPPRDFQHLVCRSCSAVTLNHKDDPWPHCMHGASYRGENLGEMMVPATVYAGEGRL